MVILITGASKGIGKFLFEEFKKKNHEVYGTWQNTPPETQHTSLYSQVDISDAVRVSAWITGLNLEGKEIVLINSAGINYNGFAHKADPASWKQVIDINVTGTFNVIRAVLPFMRTKKFGRIVSFSSVVPQLGIPGTSAYAASKAALWGITKAIAMENATLGITINTINLGYFNIGMIKEVPAEMQQAIMDKIPVHSFGNPQEILNMIEFLIGSSYMTGSGINLNGGLY